MHGTYPRIIKHVISTTCTKESYSEGHYLLFRCRFRLPFFISFFRFFFYSKLQFISYVSLLRRIRNASIGGLCRSYMAVQRCLICLRHCMISLCFGFVTIYLVNIQHEESTPTLLIFIYIYICMYVYVYPSTSSHQHTQCLCRFGNPRCTRTYVAPNLRHGETTLIDDGLPVSRLDNAMPRHRIQHTTSTTLILKQAKDLDIECNKGIQVKNHCVRRSIVLRLSEHATTIYHAHGMCLPRISV